jgi:ADP-ribose pyrophosphatase
VSEEDRLEGYLAFARRYAQCFETPVGGASIVLDPEEIVRIERLVGDRYAAQGRPREWAEVGVRYEDPYLTVVRDAVVFPDGSPGIHHRAMRPDRDPSGVVTLPILDGDVVLIRHFRHPVRAWCWEAPRGAIEPGQSPEAAVAAELAEEMEAAARELVPLGRMHGASGFMGIAVLLYLVRIEGFGAPALGEGIAEARRFNVGEIEDLVRAGEITDSFTLGCFLHARLRGLL